MDIVKIPKNRPLYLRFWYVIVALVFLIAFMIFTRKFQNVTYMVIGGELMLDTVVAGELLVSIRGYGLLIPKEVYWVGAETDGRVEKVFIRAGDRVKKGEKLVQLSNTQLLQQLRDAELEYEAQRADTVANGITLDSQLLTLKAEVASAAIDYQNAKMELDARTELMDNGANVISRIEYERSLLAVQNYLQRWDVQKQRVVKNAESLQAKKEAQQARLMLSQNTLDKVRYRVGELVVRASIDGIVQEMSLDLGQPIRQGDSITQIARPDELVAEVKIQELQINDIRLGMKTIVDTRTNIIEGRVSRIDPRVVDGSVLVEITLSGVLPPEVRPDLNIEATIEVTHIAETIYAKRPVFARALAKSSVYKVNEDGDIAERVPVLYGQASTNYIEILDGLVAGDRFIISDPTAWESHDKIFIR